MRNLLIVFGGVEGLEECKVDGKKLTRPDRSFDFYLNKSEKMVQCKHCLSVMKIFTNIMIKHLETCDKKKLGSTMENNSCDEEN